MEIGTVLKSIRSGKLARIIDRDGGQFVVQWIDSPRNGTARFSIHEGPDGRFPTFTVVDEVETTASATAESTDLHTPTDPYAYNFGVAESTLEQVEAYAKRALHLLPDNGATRSTTALVDLLNAITRARKLYLVPGQPIPTREES